VPIVSAQPTFATGCHFRQVLREAYSASPDLLAKFEGRGERRVGREWVNHGWSNNGGRGRDKGRKERRLAASKLREVPSIFSAVVAPINEDDNTVRPEGLNDIGP